MICDARLIDASAPSGSCRMRRCDQVALLDKGFAIHFSGITIRRLTEAWVCRLFSLVLFEVLH
jgi:hypothetical protein